MFFEISDIFFISPFTPYLSLFLLVFLSFCLSISLSLCLTVSLSYFFYLISPLSLATYIFLSLPLFLSGQISIFELIIAFDRNQNISEVNFSITLSTRTLWKIWFSRFEMFSCYFHSLSLSFFSIFSSFSNYLYLSIYPSLSIWPNECFRVD